MNVVTDIILPLALAFIMFVLGLGLTGNDFLRYSVSKDVKSLAMLIRSLGIFRTVVDTGSFRVWSHEAFELWGQWEKIYKVLQPSDEGYEAEKAKAQAQARSIISNVRDSYYLVNIVDNDYTSQDTDIFDIFHPNYLLDI